MTREEIIQLLRDARDLDDRIRGKQCEIDALKELAMSVRSPQITGAPRSGSFNGSRVEEDVCEYVEKEQKLELERQDLLRKKQLIYQLIESVENAKYRMVLRYRYLDGYAWKDVAERVKCGSDNVYHLHRKAIASIRVDV